MPAAAAGADDDAVLAALRSGGHAVLVRHALAPGGGLAGVGRRGGD